MKSFLNHLCHKGNRKWRFVANLLLATGYCSLAAAADLPEVSDRQPVPLSHFPDTLHAVVWRNWGLVPPERLAATLETTADKVTEVATSMGLPHDAQVPPEMKNRGYITIIRRNWHLLPYEAIVLFWAT